MFKLYGNGRLMEQCKTKKQCREAKREYKEIEKAMFGRKNIKFEIVKE